MVAIDLELLFRNHELNRCGRGYFEFNEPKPSSSKEQKNIPAHNKNEPEPITGNDENEVAKSLSNFPIVDLKEYDINEKTIYPLYPSQPCDRKTKKQRGRRKLEKS